MTKHTPAPWFAKKDGKYMDTQWSIDHEDGHDASWAPVSTTSGRTVALVVNDDTKRPMDFQDAEMQANAKLIAASPKMYALLNDLNNWLVCSCIATPEDMAQSFESYQAQIEELLQEAGTPKEPESEEGW
ncbi:hypothetical protein D3C81_1425250 [compost metagenome]